MIHAHNQKKKQKTTNLKNTGNTDTDDPNRNNNQNNGGEVLTSLLNVNAAIGITLIVLLCICIVSLVVCIICFGKYLKRARKESVENHQRVKTAESTVTITDKLGIPNLKMVSTASDTNVLNDSVCVDVSMHETDVNGGENRMAMAMAVPLTRNKKDSIMSDDSDGIYDNYSGVIGLSTNGSMITLSRGSQPQTPGTPNILEMLTPGTSTRSVIQLQGQASPPIVAGTTGRTAGFRTAYADSTGDGLKQASSSTRYTLARGSSARAVIDHNPNLSQDQDQLCYGNDNQNMENIYNGNNYNNKAVAAGNAGRKGGGEGDGNFPDIDIRELINDMEEMTNKKNKYNNGNYNEQLNVNVVPGETDTENINDNGTENDGGITAEGDVDSDFYDNNNNNNKRFKKRGTISRTGDALRNESSQSDDDDSLNSDELFDSVNNNENVLIAHNETPNNVTSGGAGSGGNDHATPSGMNDY